MQPEQVGRYTISGKIGQGGMATVYQAHDPYFEREVAVKLLPREFLHDSTFRNRFQREAKTIASLEHPAIVPVYDFGEEDGQPYLVMRLMMGGSLTDRITQGPIALPLAVRIIEQVAAALDAAHAVGIVHRDLKPSNILFDKRDNPHIADFGIVKLTETTTVLTGTGMVGTPAYMAPEMLESGGITPLIDVYALGITLYQMLTGKLPFDAETPAGMMMAHVAKSVPDPRTMRPNLPPDLHDFFQQALAKDPAARYQSAGEMASAFRTAVESSGSQYATVHEGVDPSEPYETLPSVPQAYETPGKGVRGTTPKVVLPPSTESGGRKRSILPFALIGGFVALVLLAGAGLLIGRAIFLKASPTPTAPVMTNTSAPTEAPTASVLPSPAPASFEPLITSLFGDGNWKSANDTQFVSMGSSRVLKVGDSVQTDDNSAVLLKLAEGITAEVHPGTEIGLTEITADTGSLHVVLNQGTGSSYHFIHPTDKTQINDYKVITPVASATATGTQFWVMEMEKGWCFLSTEGNVDIDLGEPDDNPLDDNYLIHATDGKGLLVGADQKVSDCQIDDLPDALTDGIKLLVVDEPTPTRSAVVGGSTGGSGTGGGGQPTSAPSGDACANNGGVQWTGDTCICPGIVDHVIVCMDGTKLDNPGSDPCDPQRSCSGTTGGSGGSGGAGGGCGSCGDFTDGPYPNCPGSCISGCEQWYDYYDSCGNYCYSNFFCG